MFGNVVRGEFDRCEVAMFVGKNPWMSHSIPYPRPTLKAIANDPDRAVMVIDPRLTETAELAEFRLRVAPGRDAWLFAAMVAIIVQEGLTGRQRHCAAVVGELVAGPYPAADLDVSRVRPSGLTKGTRCHPSITCAPELPRPRVNRPPDSASIVAELCATSAGERE